MPSVGGSWGKAESVAMKQRIQSSHTPVSQAYGHRYNSFKFVAVGPSLMQIVLPCCTKCCLEFTTGGGRECGGGVHSASARRLVVVCV